MSQEEILKIIQENPGIFQKEITLRCGHNSVMVIALVRKGMVRREYVSNVRGGAYRLWSNV